MWKDRAEEESRKVAMLEDQLKSSEKDKIKWWTRFQELLARGPSGSLDRKRKRAGHEDGRDDVSVRVDRVSQKTFVDFSPPPFSSLGIRACRIVWIPMLYCYRRALGVLSPGLPMPKPRSTLPSRPEPLLTNQLRIRKRMSVPSIWIQYEVKASTKMRTKLNSFVTAPFL